MYTDQINWTYVLYIVIATVVSIPTMIIVGNMVRNARGRKSGNPLNDFFRSISDTANGAETAFLDLLSVAVPYLVPIIPASLTYKHTIDQMGFNSKVAFTAAFVVEVLGTASVATAIRFYRWNQKYKDIKKKAPLWLAITVYAVYIIITITVNVILEIVSKSHTGWVIVAIALFSLLSFPSSVLVSIRTQFREMLEDINGKKPSNNDGGQGTDTGAGAEVQTNQQTADGVKIKHASDYKDQITATFDKHYKKTGKILKLTVISNKFGLDHEKSKGSISDIRNKWMDANGIPKPQKGQ